jgi:lipopolysaccharide assembly protein A
MRAVTLAIKLALFFIVITFAVKNTDPVTVRYFLGWEWQSPLIFVMLTAFCAGIALGLLAALPKLFRQRREITSLKREREAGRKEAEARSPTPR